MATRVMLHAWSLRSRHGSRHGQPSVIADVSKNMKHTLAIISIAASAILSNLAAATSPEELADAVQSAINSNDQATLLNLLYSQGMSEADLHLVERSQRALFTDQELEDLTLVPLPSDFQAVAVLQGKKYEATAQPQGLIQIKFKPKNGGSLSSGFPYAEVNGEYFLVGTKSTDLNWNGPPDKQIGYGVSGKGQNSVTVEVRWNASGVEQKQTLSSPSAVLMGQYFEEISVTTEDEDAELILTVREDSKEIFQSEPLKGKGTLTYNK
jgi:hypothetical protein